MPWLTATSGWHWPGPLRSSVLNGWRLTYTNDQAYDLIISVATGELDEVAAIAQHLRAHIAEW